jgi:hypothetical protein
MFLATWSRCRKPVITAFCIFYCCFSLSQNLSRRWAITPVCKAAVPTFMKYWGLEYVLILFASQHNVVPHYVYRIHFQNDAVLEWCYPGEEPVFDKPLYERIHNMYMDFVKLSPQLEADIARYLARQFDNANNHPVYVECLAINRFIRPLESESMPPSETKRIFVYRVTTQDLASSANAARNVQDHLRK